MKKRQLVIAIISVFSIASAVLLSLYFFRTDEATTNEELMKVKESYDHIEMFVPSDYEWVFTPDEELQLNENIKDGDIILYENDSLIETSVEIHSDDGSIIVHPPKDGYKKENTYELVIKSNAIDGRESDVLIYFTAEKEEIEKVKFSEGTLELDIQDVIQFDQTMQELVISEHINLTEGQIIHIPINHPAFQYIAKEVISFEKVDGQQIVSLTEPGFLEMFDEIQISNIYDLTENAIIVPKDPNIELSKIIQINNSEFVAGPLQSSPITSSYGFVIKENDVVPPKRDDSQFEEIGWNISVPKIKLNGETISIVNENTEDKDSGKSSVDANIEAMVEGEINIYEPISKLDIDYNLLAGINKFDYQFNSRIEQEMETSIKGSVIKNYTVPLLEIYAPIGTTPLFIVFDVSLFAKVEASGEVSVDIGISTETYSGITIQDDRFVPNFSVQSDSDSNFEGEGKLNVSSGLGLGGSLTAFHVIGLGTSLNTGPYGELSSRIESHKDGSKYCESAEIGLSANLGFTISLLKINLWEKDLTPLKYALIEKEECVDNYLTDEDVLNILRDTIGEMTIKLDEYMYETIPQRENEAINVFMEEDTERFNEEIYSILEIGTTKVAKEKIYQNQTGYIRIMGNHPTDALFNLNGFKVSAPIEIVEQTESSFTISYYNYGEYGPFRSNLTQKVILEFVRLEDDIENTWRLADFTIEEEGITDLGYELTFEDIKKTYKAREFIMDTSFEVSLVDTIVQDGRNILLVEVTKQGDSYSSRFFIDTLSGMNVIDEGFGEPPHMENIFDFIRSFR